ncbi:hypothetical protein ACW73L_17540 [Methylolobus aquaticus]
MHTRLAKWIRWLDVLKEEIQLLVISKHIFWSVQELIRDNPNIQIGSDFYNFLGNWYIAYSVMGVRRQLKVDAQSISFARLLTEMAEHPQVLSRAYYKSLYAGSIVEDMADKHFDRLCGGGEPHLRAATVQAELAELRRVAASCEELADRRIAHRDKRRMKKLPKFHELDACIEYLDKLYVRYLALLHAQPMDSLMPTYQYDWKEIFRVPWIPAEDGE